MERLAPFLLMLCVGCGQPQPESARTIAALEVPISKPSDRTIFLALLSKEAKAHGYHLDASSDEELRQLSSVSPISMNATVWRGNDEEAIASAMDFKDHIGRVWLTFAKGENPESSTRFRAILTSQVYRHWPNTLSLPIMPNGAIPNASDLLRTPAGYVVNPAAAATYERSAQSGR